MTHPATELAAKARATAFEPDAAADMAGASAPARRAGLAGKARAPWGEVILLAGLSMFGSVAMDTISYADPPHRFEAGTPPILEAVGWGAALDWLMAQDRQAIAAHEHALYARAVERLSGCNWLRILGDAPGKGAILSFEVQGAHAHDVAQLLDRYGVAVRAGTHCAEPLMRRFGVTSSARASFALYNTLEEADAFADALIKVQGFFA